MTYVACLDEREEHEKWLTDLMGQESTTIIAVDSALQVTADGTNITAERCVRSANDTAEPDAAASEPDCVIAGD